MTDLQWAPETCTIPTIERPVREREFTDLFRTALRDITQTSPERADFVLAADAEHTARELAAREASCCSFFAFTFTAAIAIWGVGVHPGVKTALDGYDPEEFERLIARTPYVGEIGLDAKVPSRLAKQHDVLTALLTQLQAKPRLTSIHSYRATNQVVEHLEHTPITGAILHWWLGDRSTTRRAVELGAYFSINTATVRRSDAIDLIPTDRLLLETDHPDGNRSGARPHQPGNVSDVEAALAKQRGVTTAQIRAHAWRNLATLVNTTGTKPLLPPRVEAILGAIE